MPEQVAILHERRFTLPTTPGGAKELIEITYRPADGFPRTVLIDPDHDSPEERVRVISEDLKRSRAFKPPTLDLPD